MAGSARKPYLRLKKSLVDFFRAPIVYLKNINQKFSEFEKPYLEGEYPQMHLEWPSWNWGPWKTPQLGPVTPFGSIPQIKVGCVLHCWHWNDCEDWIYCSVLHWSGSLAKELGTFEVTGDILEWYLSGAATDDIRIKVNSEVSNPIVSVKYTDPVGNRCYDDAEIECNVCSAEATILYTSLQMQASQAQTLRASESGSAYTWAITAGGGSLTKSTGNKTVYVAPATNAECADNPTIELSCEGVAIDSITIAVNAVDGNDVGYYCCDNIPPYSYHAFAYTQCNGGKATGSYAATCENTNSPCNTWTAGTHCEFFAGLCSAVGMSDGEWADLRTEEQITAGCCPEQAL